MRSKKIGDDFPVCVGKFVSLGHGRILRLKGENSTENQAFRGSGGVSKVFIQSLALLNYAHSHQHRPLAKEIIQSFMQAKPEAVAASMRENMIVHATEVAPGKLKTIRLFKSKQEENFYEAVRRVFPTYHPYPNVALSCVLDYPAIKNQLSEKARSYFFRGIVDSVVFDVGSGYQPKYFIELDSSFHDDPQAQANDQLKDAIFRAANAKLIRIRPLDAKVASVEEFERLVRELMRQL